MAIRTVLRTSKLFKKSTSPRHRYHGRACDQLGEALLRRASLLRKAGR